MEGITLIDTLGYLINAGTLGLAYWLLRVRDRLLSLEKDYGHIAEKLDDMEDLKGRMDEMNSNLRALVVELRSKGVINGASKHD